jgi:hypothetical protein
MLKYRNGLRTAHAGRLDEIGMPGSDLPLPSWVWLISICVFFIGQVEEVHWGALSDGVVAIAGGVGSCCL